MSWEAIIDQMKEWVQAQGYLTTGYVDRGDPAVPDWNQATLTIDGGYHALDLSGIVPAGAKAVALSYRFQAGAIAAHSIFRRHGNANAHASANITNQVAFTPIYGDFVVAVDDDRKIDYLIPVVPATFILLTVKGWWL